MEKKIQNSKVTICVPFFNQENYVEETLDSVFSQSYEDYEVIIRDDMSTDNTASAIKKYFEKNKPKIRYLIIYGEKNVGVVESFNIMFSKANGEYIALQGGDDLSLPSRIEESVYLLEIYNRDLVAVDAKGIDENNNIIFESFYKNALHCEEFYKKINGDIVNDRYGEKNVFLSPNRKHLQCKDCMGGFGIMFRKSIIEPYGNKLPSTIKYEDRFLTFLALCGEGVIQYNKQLVLYRRIGSNYSLKIAENDLDKYNEILRINLLTLPVILEEINCLLMKKVNIEEDNRIKILKVLKADIYCCKYWLKSLDKTLIDERKINLIIKILLLESLGIKEKMKYTLMFLSSSYTNKQILDQYKKREKTFS